MRTVLSIGRKLGLAALALAAFTVIGTASVDAAPPSKCFYVNGKLVCDNLVVPRVPVKPNPCLSCPAVPLHRTDLVTNPVVPATGAGLPGTR